MRVLVQTLLATTAIGFSFPGAHAQTVTDSAPDDVIVVTGVLNTFGATKSDTPIVETARSVSVETDEMFIAKGALTLDDVLGYTSGVVGEQFGFATRGDFYAVRGLDAPEYRDNLQSLFGNYNNTRPEIYTLEQVEVLKGPASVLFGQGSPGGLINTVSKIAGADFDNEIFVSYGSHDRVQIGGDFSFALSDTVFARLVALYRESDTQVAFVNDDALVLAPSLTWQPSAGTSLTLLVNYDDRDSDTAHQFLPLAGTLNAPAGGPVIESSTYLGEPGFNTYDTESTAVTLIGSHALSDTLTLEGTARYRDGESTYRQSWVSFVGTGIPRIDAAGNGRRSWYDNPATSEQFATDIRLRAQFATGDIEHEVLAGVNYQDIELSASRAFIWGNGVLNVFNPVYGNGVPTSAVFDAVRAPSESGSEYTGFYVNDQVEIGRLRLNAGVRFDTVETRSGATVQDDDATTFAVGALYAFGNGLSPYISYAESFEPVIGTDGVTGNPLKPQEGEQIEIGIKYQPDSRTYLTLAWFDIEQSNLPNPAGLPTAPSQQEGVTEVSGFEFEFITSMDTDFGDLSIEANASILDTEDPNGQSLPSVPDTQASLWTMLAPSAASDLTVGAGLRYLGENKSYGAHVVTAAPVLVTTESATLADLLVSYDFDATTLSLNVRNLFDETFYATCLARGDCFPGEQRSVSLRLATRF